MLVFIILFYFIFFCCCCLHSVLPFIFHEHTEHKKKNMGKTHSCAQTQSYHYKATHRKYYTHTHNKLYLICDGEEEKREFILISFLSNIIMEI